jgi:hypothetical protein
LQGTNKLFFPQRQRKQALWRWDQVDLAEVHRKRRRDRVFSVGHRLRQMLVVLVKVDEAGSDEDVDDVLKSML